MEDGSSRNRASSLQPIHRNHVSVLARCYPIASCTRNGCTNAGYWLSVFTILLEPVVPHRSYDHNHAAEKTKRAQVSSSGISGFASDILCLLVLYLTERPHDLRGESRVCSMGHVMAPLCSHRRADPSHICARCFSRATGISVLPWQPVS